MKDRKFLWKNATEEEKAHHTKKMLERHLIKYPNKCWQTHRFFISTECII